MRFTTYSLKPNYYQEIATHLVATLDMNQANSHIAKLLYVTKKVHVQ